jgi:hypothetical protein
LYSKRVPPEERFMVLCGTFFADGEARLLVARVNFFVDAQPSDWISTRKQEECVEKVRQVCEESCC